MSRSRRLSGTPKERLWERPPGQRRRSSFPISVSGAKTNARSIGSAQRRWDSPHHSTDGHGILAIRGASVGLDSALRDFDRRVCWSILREKSKTSLRGCLEVLAIHGRTCSGYLDGRWRERHGGDGASRCVHAIDYGRLGLHHAAPMAKTGPAGEVVTYNLPGPVSATWRLKSITTLQGLRSDDRAVYPIRPNWT